MGGRGGGVWGGGEGGGGGGGGGGGVRVRTIHSQCVVLMTHIVIQIAIAT